MKKIISISIFILISALALFATTESRFLFNQLDTVANLAITESVHVSEGKLIKAQKSKSEIINILNSLFYNGKIIKSDENMAFARIATTRYFYIDSYGEYGEREIDNFSIQLHFRVFDKDDCFHAEKSTIQTPDNIIEKFENTDAFIGKIQIVQRGFVNPQAYEVLYMDGEINIIVYCKILEIK